MAAKKATPTKDSEVVPEPAPVDVKASVPLEIKMSPETIEAIGEAVKTEMPTPESITQSDEFTPVPAAKVEAPPLGTPVVTTTTTTTAPVPATVAKADDLTLTPTTTAADDRVTEGQRLTSLLWESTQATISVAITLAVIYCAIAQINSETITNAFFFIVATYFTRTNHVKVGGVGPKNGNGVYRGR